MESIIIQKADSANQHHLCSREDTVLGPRKTGVELRSLRNSLSLGKPRVLSGLSNLPSKER